MAEDIACIFGIPLGGWDHYVKFCWPPLNNMSLALAITRKFFGNPNLAQHHYVLKKEMSPRYLLYFDMVHKIMIPRKERRIKGNYLDLTLMELLDTKVKIDLPNLIIKNIQRMLPKDDKKAHAFPYRFWLAQVFEEYVVPV